MWQLRGYGSLTAQIDKGLKEGRQAHAYLLVGPRHVGKLTLATNMAQAVNCLTPMDAPCGECGQCQRVSSGRHADVVVIGGHRDTGGDTSRREIGIGDVRDLQRQTSLEPYEGRSRVYILDGAEHMSDEAANALLKTLEEPPPRVMMLLLTAHEDVLLPTVRSRCRRLELKPLPLLEVARELVDAGAASSEEAEVLARLSMGRLGWAISAAGDPSVMEARQRELERISSLSMAGLEDRFSYAAELASLFSRNREEAREVLSLWLRWWRDLLLVKEKAEEFVYNMDWAETLGRRASACTNAQVAGFIRALLTTIEALEHNANPRLALETLMLDLPLEKAAA